jgi:glyoxylase-like metal-dependent hydrolase (beta-lactamase superfamily II)
MNDLEKQLHYPLDDALPAYGACISVAPGVKWLRMTLPFALNHINLWLLRDAVDGVAGWSIVDTCIHCDEARAHWEAIFAHELEGLPVLRVIATHMHPDHIGLAHWLCTRWNAPFFISATDFMVASVLCTNPDASSGERTVQFYAQHGLNDAETASKLRARKPYFTTLVPSVPAQYHRLLDGGRLPIGPHTWQCISGYGHAPEHMALYCAELGVLIGGDMMLPRISTNVSVYEQEPEADALTLFLASIERFTNLPADTLVLPSHGKPFKGLHTRIQQLHAHHRERLAEVIQACATTPCSAADVLPVLFKRPLDFHQITFALGEAVAHLHALWHGGKLTRHMDADGVYRFRPAGGPAHRSLAGG